MATKAILFGSIGTLVETSELQRRAFNQAFGEAGLDWNWDTDTYARLLTKSGGQDRVQSFASGRMVNVDARQLHLRKTEIFNALMTKEDLPLRPGVTDVIDYARSHRIKLAFATTTSQVNIDAIFGAVGDQIRRNDFTFVGNALLVLKSKPSPDIYVKALSELHLDAQDCIAIEDTEISMQAALTAGIRCIAFPGAFAQAHDFSGALLVTDRLSPDYFSEHVI